MKTKKEAVIFFLRVPREIIIIFHLIKARKKPHSPSQVESTLKWFKCLLRDRDRHSNDRERHRDRHRERHSDDRDRHRDGIEKA